MSEYAPAANIQEEVLTFLLSAPTPQAIISFQASKNSQERLQYLLEGNRQGTLSNEESAELEEASQLNNLIILLKAQAHQAMQSK